jgi:hypothetical protein
MRWTVTSYCTDNHGGKHGSMNGYDTLEEAMKFVRYLMKRGTEFDFWCHPAAYQILCSADLPTDQSSNEKSTP